MISMSPSEEALLGCMLIDGDAQIAREATPLLDSDDFIDPVGRRIFEAIRKILNEGAVPDLISVSRLCPKDIEDIAELSSKIVHTHNWRRYFMEVIQDSSLRKLQKRGREIQNEPDIDGALEALISEINIIQSRLQGPEDFSAKSIAQLSMNGLDERSVGQKPGLITPIPLLTSYIGGWRSPDLITIAARPSIGKTAFGLANADKTLEQGKAVIIFSLEMKRAQLLDRLIIGRSGVDALGYRTGKLSADEFMRAQNAAGYYADQRLWIVDKGSISLGEIEAFCMKKRKEGNCDLVIVDYLQLMKTRSQKNRTRDGDIAELSRGFKLLAKDLDVPVMVLSQLNREVEKRGNKRPILSDLRESGAIEQDADIVIMLYRAAYYGERYVNVGHEEISSQGIGELSISKHRNGETGTIFWTHNDSLTRIGGYPSTDYETVTAV